MYDKHFWSTKEVNLIITRDFKARKSFDSSKIYCRMALFGEKICATDFFSFGVDQRTRTVEHSAKTDFKRLKSQQYNTARLFVSGRSPECYDCLLMFMEPSKCYDCLLMLIKCNKIK